MLTPSQQRALDTTRNLSVTANAGSGKTLVLVKRFVRILQERPDVQPENIAAITFTDKAAGELHAKIVKEFDAAIAERPADGRLRALRGRIHAAFIGTIHSFCKNLLGAYPLEAGVDAEFTILDSAERNLYLEESIGDAFRAALAEENPDYAQNRNLFLKLGRSKAEKIVKLFLNKRELRDSITRFYGQRDDEIIAGWNSAVNAEKEKICRSAPIASIEELLQSVKPSERVTAAQDYLSQFRKNDNTPHRFASLASLYEALLTKGGTLRSQITGSGKNKREYPEIEREIIVSWETMSLFLPAAPEEDNRRDTLEMLAMSRQLWLLSQTVDAEYERKKENAGALDFDDLQLRAVDLLRDADVRREMQAQYKYIMVDEFQDTNRLQYELVELLTERNTLGNLFIVGDPKQSIYGFRNAEVEVFLKAKESIAGKATSGGVNSGAEVLLSESFRMLPAIAGFVNYLFSDLMRGDAVQYDALIATPSRDNAPIEKMSGYVECIFPEVPEHKAKTDDVNVEESVDRNIDENGQIHQSIALPEEEYIALRVKELTGGNDENIVVYHSGEARSPLYSDVAILLRKRAGSLAKLESALHRHGIPFIVAGGIGFYNRQEILDVMNYLRFLLNPEDDVALLGILRSPFFTVSDAELFAAAFETRRNEALHSFWEKSCAYSDATAVSARFAGAVARLKSDIEICHRISLTELLYRITVETGWIGSIAGNPLAEQARANVEKMIAMARDFERRGFTSLFDFVGFLESMVDSAEKEGQAAVEAAGNVVRIMTIHAAKGLEFPIVFLPFLGAEANNRDDIFYDDAFGLGFTSDGESRSEIYKHMRSRAAGKAEEEERRIFYVACTRARDALILSGTGTKSKSWLGWLKSLLGEGFQEGTVELQSHDGRNDVTNIQIHIRTTLPRLSGASISKTDIPLDAEKNITIAVQEIAGESRGEFFSASHFVAHEQCPMKYVLRYMLGAPEQYAPRQSAERAGDDRIYGTERGTIAHAALARMDVEASQARDENVLREIVAGEAKKIEQDGDEAARLTDDVMEIIRGATQSEIGRKIFSSETFFCEHEISAALGAHFIHGVIDRLYSNAPGAWRVVDYKTDRISSANVAVKVNAYRMQLQVYAYLVFTLFPGTERVTTNLFFLRAPQLSREEVIERATYPALKAEIEDRLAAILRTQRDPARAFQNLKHCPDCAFGVKKPNGVQCLAS